MGSKICKKWIYELVKLADRGSLNKKLYLLTQSRDTLIYKNNKWHLAIKPKKQAIALIFACKKACYVL